MSFPGYGPRGQYSFTASGITAAPPSGGGGGLTTPQMWQSTNNGSWTRYGQSVAGETVGSGKQGWTHETWVDLAGATSIITSFTINDFWADIKLNGIEGSSLGTLEAYIGRSFQNYDARVNLPAGTVSKAAPFRLRASGRYYDGVTAPEIWVQINEGAPYVASALVASGEGTINTATAGAINSSKRCTFQSNAAAIYGPHKFWWGYSEPGTVPTGTPAYRIDPGDATSDYSRLLAGGAPVAV